jgi:hypothetical protein
MKKLALAILLISSTSVMSAAPTCNSTYNPYSNTPCNSNGSYVSYNPNPGGVEVIHYPAPKPTPTVTPAQVPTPYQYQLVPLYDAFENKFASSILYGGVLFNVTFKCDLTTATCKIIGVK